MKYYRQAKKYCKWFYRAHREGFDLVGDFLGACSIFVFLYALYVILWLLGC
ncbi:hypothetical protein CE91St46_14260 [Eubacteriales bacterium]|nr:hypothetical protein CE91St46_14260 [Eubacteriales bacterium]GKH62952.1 hypothetical protein CE91St47_14210 [Eubacteriales bacterium]